MSVTVLLSDRTQIVQPTRKFIIPDPTTSASVNRDPSHLLPSHQGTYLIVKLQPRILSRYETNN
jgi:hypothetical protein